MSSETKRLFFAVNLPEEVKKEISERLLGKIPAENWRKVLEENLHITIKFLGQLPKESLREIQEKIQALENLSGFELELKGIGHFRGRLLWLGVGKGTEECCILSRKLNGLLGTFDDSFHPHLTLARNRGAPRKETDALIESLRKENFSAKIGAESLDLMESQLRKSGPIYTKIYSLKFLED